MAKKQIPAFPRRKYGETFKAEAVRLVTTGNRSVPDVARSLGISDNLPYNWKNKTAHRPQNGVSQEEHDQLREQLRRTEQERDILKSVDSEGPVEWPRQPEFHR